MRDHNPVHISRLERCDEPICHLPEGCSPQQLTDDEIAFMRVNTLQDWLQDAPRTTTEVARVLLPAAWHPRIWITSETLLDVGRLLFDCGYTPMNRNALDTSWHWLEGTSLEPTLGGDVVSNGEKRASDYTGGNSSGGMHDAVSVPPPSKSIGEK